MSSAIAGSAINTSIGTISHERNVLTFSTVNIPSDPSSISKLLVDSTRGISVGDVASVRNASTVDSYARVNGTPMVLVDVQKTTDSNTVAVVHDVESLMAKTRLPQGYSYVVSYDSTGPISASIQNTFSELVVTSIVVAIIVLLFLGKLNTALSVILAIPIALSASPILYKLCGFNFNLVSLLALVSAIGIVVDDSIVVSENVERYRKMGFSLKESVLKGASEVFSAVIAASLSLLSVLIPVSFIGGFIGRYIQQFSLGLAAAVGFSLFEALLFLTVRLAYTPEAKIFDWKDFAQSFGMLRIVHALGPLQVAQGLLPRGRSGDRRGPGPHAALRPAPGRPALSRRPGPRLLPRADPAHVLPGSHDDPPQPDRAIYRLGQGRLRATSRGRRQAERVDPRRRGRLPRPDRGPDSPSHTLQLRPPGRQRIHVGQPVPAGRARPSTSRTR